MRRYHPIKGLLIHAEVGTGNLSFHGFTGSSHFTIHIDSVQTYQTAAHFPDLVCTANTAIWELPLYRSTASSAQAYSQHHLSFQAASPLPLTLTLFILCSAPRSCVSLTPTCSDVRPVSSFSCLSAEVGSSLSNSSKAASRVSPTTAASPSGLNSLGFTLVVREVREVRPERATMCSSVSP